MPVSIEIAHVVHDYLVYVTFRKVDMYMKYDSQVLKRRALLIQMLMAEFPRGPKGID